ncbi:MAG: CAP domain-containing protein, partial [Chloroflexi bacterium]|nr:CAP domain-containing protein [Chloroflexota bacterium]
MATISPSTHQPRQPPPQLQRTTPHFRLITPPKSTILVPFLTIALFILVACAPTENPRFPPLAGEMSEGQRGLALTQSEHATLVDHALTLINDARSDAGLNELSLDTNTAAQSHAEQSRDACTRGHWDADGLKPYMRYTIAGGEQYSSENVFAIDFCPEDLSNYDLETPREQIDFAMDRFLNSPGHRQNILDPHHRKV